MIQFPPLNITPTYYITIQYNLTYTHCGGVLVV